MRELLLRAPEVPGRAAVIADGEAVPWAELAARAAAAVEALAPLRGARVGVRLAGSAGCWAALAALDALDAATALLDAALPEDACRRLSGELGLAAIVSAAGAGARAPRVEVLLPEAPAGTPRAVTILSSGTTGRPKAVRHTWASLARPVRRAGRGAGTWLLSYRPSLYAGLQVALQALADRGTLVVPPAGAAPGDVARLLVERGVDCASATPSYWRRLLLFADPAVLRSAPLRQVTVGGELVDQQLLDRLAALFPAARIVHVYATTELGRCFSVADRRAGFPAAWLGAVSPDGVELREVDGELHVRSANAMAGYDVPGAPGGAPPGLLPTGDLVEVRGDRAFFAGRRTDVINVGGNKVHPAEVERVLRSIPGLGDVRVYARPSSIAGELVACDVVPAPGADAARLRAEIARRCAAGLRGWQRPRLVRVVGEIAVSPAGKVLRRSTP